MIKTSPAAYCLFVIFISISFLLTGCNNSGEKIPDVSGIKISLQTARFDLDFTSIDTNHIGEGLQKLYAKYPDFLNYYLDSFMTFGINKNYTDTSHAALDSLKPYLVYKDYVNLEDTIKKDYPDTKDINEQLTTGFRYVKYYLPNYFVPKILYINAFLSKWPAFALDTTTICVGLDWFLGEQYPFYASVGVPPYQGAHLRKSYLPVSVFNTVYESIHPFKTANNTLLDLMLQRGKEQYFLHKVLPHTVDSVLFGYPDRKLKWCSENEGMIYNFFIHEGLLYNKEPQNIIPYVYDGPFALNMPATDAANNTPGNIGTWLGYKIVCAYMAKHPEITLQRLLDEQQDAAQFLDAAKYRPK